MSDPWRVRVTPNINKYDIAIIGAGPVGLLCATYAIRAGLKPIIITLPPENEKTAGIAAGGMLAPAYEFFDGDNDIASQFALLSRFEWNHLSKLMGINIDKNALALANNETEIAKLYKIQKNAQKFNEKFDFIKVPDFLNAKYALSLSTDALLNPNLVMARLKEFLNENSAPIIFDEIKDIEAETLIGLKTQYKAKKIIIANGFEASRFANVFPILNKLKPVRGQTIEIDAKPNFNGSIRYLSTYLMARGDKIIIGATSQKNDSDWRIRQEDNDILFENAKKILPEIANAKLLRSFCGLRPQSIDELPIIGATQIENVYFAVGAYRNGWAFAPMIAKLLIEEISHEMPVPEYLSPKRIG